MTSRNCDKIFETPNIKPGLAGQGSQMLPICHAAKNIFSHKYSQLTKLSHPGLFSCHDLLLVQHLHRVIPGAEVVQQDDSNLWFAKEHLEVKQT